MTWNFMHHLLAEKDWPRINELLESKPRDEIKEQLSERDQNGVVPLHYMCDGVHIYDELALYTILRLIYIYPESLTQCSEEYLQTPFDVCEGVDMTPEDRACDEVLILLLIEVDYVLKTKFNKILKIYCRDSYDRIFSFTNLLIRFMLLAKNHRTELREKKKSEDEDEDEDKGKDKNTKEKKEDFGLELLFRLCSTGFHCPGSVVLEFLIPLPA